MGNDLPPESYFSITKYKVTVKDYHKFKKINVKKLPYENYLKLNADTKIKQETNANWRK